MPKRSNPWSTDTAQQLKTHIGKKEIANGVDGQQMQTEIYEYTKAMMTEGAKKFYTNSNTSMETDSESTNGNNKAATKETITAFLKGEKIKPMEINNNKMNGNGKSLCRTCHSDSILAMCSFCDQMTCGECARTCAVCSQMYCSLCAIPQYNTPVDSARCFNCSNQSI